MKMNNQKQLITHLLLEELFLNDFEIIYMSSTMFQEMEYNIKSILIMQLKPAIPPKLFRSEEWLEDYDRYHFYNIFRMEKRTFQKFIRALGERDKQRLLSKSYKGGHHPIDIFGHALIFVWYMSTQDRLLTIATVFKVCPATVMNVVNRVLFIVLLLKPIYIKLPQTNAELEEISNGFADFPGVAGVVDGTHVFLKVDEENQDSYIDRYRRHSINIMAICDSNRMFLYIFVGFPGSAHDERVFQNSILYKNIQRTGHERYFGNRHHLIGDSAFTLRQWLMTPFRGNHLNRVEKHYNKCLSKCRVKVEHSFGVMKGRWRRVQFINTYSVFKAIEISSAACIMHNFCLLQGDEWNERFETNILFDPQDNEQEQFNARAKRNEIAFMLFNNQN